MGRPACRATVMVVQALLSSEIEVLGGWAADATLLLLCNLQRDVGQRRAQLCLRRAPRAAANATGRGSHLDGGADVGMGLIGGCLRFAGCPPWRCCCFCDSFSLPCFRMEGAMHRMFTR